MRSRMIATTTMMKPDSNPSAVLTEFNARTTGTPSPSAPTSAAITTIDSESMIVWLSPVMIWGRAKGSSTFHSTCFGVAPNACAASSSGCGVEVIPRWVSRIGAGSTKITVAMRPGTMPMPKNTMAGIR